MLAFRDISVYMYVYIYIYIYISLSLSLSLCAFACAPHALFILPAFWDKDSLWFQGVPGLCRQL